MLQSQKQAAKLSTIWECEDLASLFPQRPGAATITQLGLRKPFPLRRRETMLSSTFAEGKGRGFSGRCFAAVTCPFSYDGASVTEGLRDPSTYAVPAPVISSTTMPSTTNMLVLRVELRDTDPLVWRLIAVPSNYNLADLHELLQMVMGWENSHLHLFRINGKEYSADQQVEGTTRTNLKIAMACKLAPKGFEYVYDFGDEWSHWITAVDKFKEPKDDALPLCLDGARSCPPEDVGGPPGYQDFLEAFSDENHENHEDMVEWVGTGFDPESFNARHVSACLIGWWRQRQALQLAASSIAVNIVEAELGLDFRKKQLKGG